MVEDLTVRDVMTHEYIGASGSDTVRDVAEVLLENEDQVAAVVEGAKPIGMVTKSSLLRAVLDGGSPEETTIETVLKSPPPFIHPDESITDAAMLLANAETSHLFVGDSDELLGVLSENDVITAVTSMLTHDVDASPTNDLNQYETQITRSPDDSDADPGEVASQSVCEICGTLKSDLETVNGQLVCSDCQDI